MSLLAFLSEHKQEILDYSETKVVALAALRPSSPAMKVGLPTFFDQLVAVLLQNRDIVSFSDEAAILGSAGIHGKELLRLGYTLSQVVHSYGAICQSVTELASRWQAPVTAIEFRNLNRCLDVAIAGAVTEFESVRSQETKGREVLSLGTLVHELRNALNRATIASEMIMKGIVGVGGSTSKVLQYSLMEMQQIIDRSLTEVRLRADNEAYNERFLVADLINQLVITAEVEATLKDLTLSLELDPTLEVNTDKHLLLAAIGNLVQNAMKFTKPKTNISLVVRGEGQSVWIEVSDQCGGLSEGTYAQLFKPYTQESPDRSGLGLGLVISQEAIRKCGGSLSARNCDGGCSFRISVPRAGILATTTPPVV